MSSLATGFEHFGAQLFSTISQQNNGQNVFLSPASIALAVSMCTVGAGHETLQQMLNVFKVSSTKELTNTAGQVMQIFSFADQDKSSTNESTDSDASEGMVYYTQQYSIPLQLQLANRLYAFKNLFDLILNLKISKMKVLKLFKQ
jgi:serine protease inhibitor